MAINSEFQITDSNFPEEGLRFFHGLANWVEDHKHSNQKLISWKDGQKRLTLLTCTKAPKKEKLSVPKQIPDNSFYLPDWCSGRQAIKQIRHAFCHGNLKYDSHSEQYSISLTDKVHIAGRFSLDAIREFVNTYLQQKEEKRNTKR